MRSASSIISDPQQHRCFGFPRNPKIQEPEIGSLFRVKVDPTINYLQVAVPTVDPDERILVQKLSFPGLYRAVARYGYQDRVDHGQPFVLKLIEKVRCIEVLIKSKLLASIRIVKDTTVNRQRWLLVRCCDAQSVFR